MSIQHHPTDIKPEQSQNYDTEIQSEYEMFYQNLRETKNLLQQMIRIVEEDDRASKLKMDDM